MRKVGGLKTQRLQPYVGFFNLPSRQGRTRVGESSAASREVLSEVMYWVFEEVSGRGERMVLLAGGIFALLNCVTCTSQVCKAAACKPVSLQLFFPTAGFLLRFPANLRSSVAIPELNKPACKCETAYVFAGLPQSSGEPQAWHFPESRCLSLRVDVSYSSFRNSLASSNLAISSQVS